MTERTFDNEAQESYKNRTQWLKDAMEQKEKAQEEDDDEKLEQIEEENDPLAIDISFIIDIQLSTGGPAEGYTLECDEDGYVSFGKFYYRHWDGTKEFHLSRSQIEQVQSLYNLDDDMIKMMIQNKLEPEKKKRW